MKEQELHQVIKDLGDHVAISFERITPAMIEQPGLYAYYALAHARALREERTFKLSMQNRRAQLRREITKNTTKAVTEEMLNEACAHDRVHQDTVAQHIEAQYSADVLEAVCRTFEHRRDMLVNVGATHREEMRSIEIRTPVEPLARQAMQGAKKTGLDGKQMAGKLYQDPNPPTQKVRGKVPPTALDRMLAKQRPIFKEADIPF